jgi:hypothetical protein
MLLAEGAGTHEAPHAPVRRARALARLRAAPQPVVALRGRGRRTVADLAVVRSLLAVAGSRGRTRCRSRRRRWVWPRRRSRRGRERGCCRRDRRQRGCGGGCRGRGGDRRVVRGGRSATASARGQQGRQNHDARSLHDYLRGGTSPRGQRARTVSNGYAIRQSNERRSGGLGRATRPAMLCACRASSQRSRAPCAAPATSSSCAPMMSQRVGACARW